MEIGELKNRIKAILGDVDCIKAIGNHQLKRHLVYKLSYANKNYVIKLYYRKNRWNREVASLKFLKNTRVLAPQVVDYGIFDDGLEWLIYEFIDSSLLSNIFDNIAVESLKRIYYQMGKQLSLIHNFREFDFFGSMYENGRSINNFTTYRDYFQNRMNRILFELQAFKHEKSSLLEEAESQIKSMYSILDGVDKAVLCHNDFDARNILIAGNDGKYYLKAVIDFEQCIPDDLDKELIYYYLPLLKNDQILAESFKTGYEENGDIDMDRLLIKKDFYNLYKGIGICAWAKEVDYDYYLQGIKLIEDTLSGY